MAGIVATGWNIVGISCIREFEEDPVADQFGMSLLYLAQMGVCIWRDGLMG